MLSYLGRFFGAVREKGTSLEETKKEGKELVSELNNLGEEETSNLIDTTLSRLKAEQFLFREPQGAAKPKPKPLLGLEEFTANGAVPLG